MYDKIRNYLHFIIYWWKYPDQYIIDSDGWPDTRLFRECRICNRGQLYTNSGALCDSGWWEDIEENLVNIYSR